MPVKNTRHTPLTPRRWYHSRKSKFILLAVLPSIFMMVVAECGYRAYWYYKHKDPGAVQWRNYRRGHIDLLESSFPFVFDEALGYVPEPGSQLFSEAWGVPVTINDDGLRSNGIDTETTSSCQILVVGDSFTFGDQVADCETWPAYLDTLTTCTVLNGGVSGYGLDQIVLRGEELTAKYRPDVLVLSLIADDIDRCALSCRHA